MQVHLDQVAQEHIQVDEKETPKPIWAACSSAWSSNVKKFYHCYSTVKMMYKLKWNAAHNLTMKLKLGIQ